MEWNLKEKICNSLTYFYLVSQKNRLGLGKKTVLEEIMSKNFSNLKHQLAYKYRKFPSRINIRTRRGTHHSHTTETREQENLENSHYKKGKFCIRE